MKVAHIMAGATLGGAELFYERLVPALVASGEEVLPIIRRDGPRGARLAAAGVRPVQLGFGGRLDPVTSWRVGRRLRGFAPRVAVAWMGRAARHTPAGPWVLVGRLGGNYAIGQFAHCDHLVGNTPGMVDWIRGQGFPAARVHLLANFVTDASGATPAALPVPEGARVVLAMGRLHRTKGFDVLIAAMTRLPGDVHAVIAGDGPERAALIALAAQAGVGGRVHLLGWRNDTAALLAACAMLVCPSRHEPLGNVVLEAFSARRPVVAASAEGPVWLLGDGARGLLVPIDSGVALAGAMGAMLDSPDMAARMAAEGRARFETRFSEAAVVAEWRAFCSSVQKVEKA